jgi:hypothetical protein
MICGVEVPERPERREAFEATLNASNVLHAAYFLHKWVCGELEPVAAAERLVTLVTEVYCQTCLCVLVPSEDWDKKHHEPAPGAEKRASFVRRLAMPGTLLRDSVLCAYYLLVLTRESEDAAPLLTRDAVKIAQAPPLVLHPFGKSPQPVKLTGAVHANLEVHYFAFADLQTELAADFYARAFDVAFRGARLCRVKSMFDKESLTPFVAPSFGCFNSHAVMFVHTVYEREPATGAVNFVGEPEQVSKFPRLLDMVAMLRAVDEQTGEERWALLHPGHCPSDDWPLLGWRGPCVDLKTRLEMVDCTRESVTFAVQRPDAYDSLSTVAVRLKNNAVVEHNGRVGPFDPHDSSVPAYVQASEVGDMWNVLSPFYGARMTGTLRAEVSGRVVYVTLP